MDTATTIRRSRRAVLGAALGATAATVASAIELPRVALASSNGATVTIGSEYLDAQYQTKIVNTSTVAGGNDYNRAMWLESQIGIALYAAGDTGVYSSGATRGVVGATFNASGFGVTGLQGNTSLPFFTPDPAGVVGLTFGTDAAAGVRGYAYQNSGGTYGVWGRSDSTTSAFGVYGLASSATSTVQGVGVYGHAMSSAGVGTYGYAESATGTTYGAVGHALSPTGVGVWGVAPNGGVGVRATSNGGLALQTSGRVRLDKASGVASIPKGKASVTVKPGVAVVSSAFVLLTPRGNLGSRGLWYTLSASAGTITIRVSSAVTAATQVGWLLVG